MKRLHRPMIAALAATFAAAMILFSAGEAQARYNCGVKRTADGFVALRDSPSPAGKLITRMKPGELVGLLHPPKYEDIVRKGRWLFVRYVPGSNINRANDADHDKAIPGWVNDALLNCHE